MHHVLNRIADGQIDESKNPLEVKYDGAPIRSEWVFVRIARIQRSSKRKHH